MNDLKKVRHFNETNTADNLHWSSKKKNRKHAHLDDTENTLSTQTMEVTDNADVLRKKHKKNKSTSKVELFQENNIVDEKTDDSVYQSFVSRSNDDILNSSTNINETDTSLIRKKKKRKRNSANNCNTGSQTEQNNNDAELLASKNKNTDNRLDIGSSIKFEEPMERGSAKRKKRKKNFQNESEMKNFEPEQNNHDGELLSAKNTNTENILDLQNVSSTHNMSKKKRKRNRDGDSDPIIQSETNNNSSSNQELRSETENSAVDDFATLMTKCDESSEWSPKKKKRKKNKNQNNFDSNTSQELPSSETVENSSNEKPPSKPLKSSLKKKKRKNKRKSIDQTKLKGDSGDLKMKQKNSSKKSVSFDENVKVEVIESYQATANEKSQESDDRKKENAFAYLRTWKDDKTNWKFKKITQLWLLKNMYQENMVPAEIFSILLEYLVNLKGFSRDLVVDLSNKIIAKKEQTTTEEIDQELETAYNRAKSVLQFI